MNSALDKDKYEHLVEQIQATISVSVHNSRWILVEGYWNVGKIIREHYTTKSPTSQLQGLAVDVGISQRTLWYALQTYDTYPDLSSIPEGNNISWNKLITKYLPKNVEARKIENSAESKIDMACGDFRKLGKCLADHSIDLILTDPPYPHKYLDLWKPLGELAKRVLKPGGFLIAYSGQLYLPEVMSQLAESLRYYWCGTLYHEGRVAQRFEVNMFNRGKKIMFYVNGLVKPQAGWIDDVLHSPAADKDLHEWGQSIEPLKKLITAFTEPGNTVLDPFLGGGATVEACNELKRNCMGFEIDKETYEQAKERFR